MYGGQCRGKSSWRYSRSALHGTLRAIVASLTVSLVVLAAVSITSAQGISSTDRTKIGLTALSNLLGGSAPTGAGITAAQVEAPLTTGGSNYLPNASDPQLTSDTIIDKHGAGTTSTHATAVAQGFYGSSGVAPGVSTIDAYNSNLWIYSSFLRTNNWQAPQVTTRKVMNHSWVGSFANGGNDGIAHSTDALRRIDYVVERDNVVVVAGVNNGVTPFPQILGNAYNVIAVGLSSGNSSPGPSTIDVAGRTKPDIVAPATSTSVATSWVSGAAAILLETAGANTSAARPETIKAVMLAGATKSEFDLTGETATTFDDWSRTPEHPLDYQYGAGELNVFNSYRILAAGQRPASDSSDVASTGWDYTLVDEDTLSSYFFEIPEGSIATSVSVVAAWNREIQFTTGINFDPATLTPTLADANIGMFKADGFNFGEMIDYSVSTIDNVEHVYQTWLPAGRYSIVVASDTSENVAVAWDSQLVLLGDANLDGFVNASDYTIWADNYLESNANWGMADFNQDGWVNGSDYTVWADHYSPNAAMATAVPEPSTLLLAVTGLLGAALWRFRRRS